jgi:hypothetical protein
LIKSPGRVPDHARALIVRLARGLMSNETLFEMRGKILVTVHREITTGAIGLHRLRSGGVGQGPYHRLTSRHPCGMPKTLE